MVNRDEYKVTVILSRPTLLKRRFQKLIAACVVMLCLTGFYF